MRPSYNRNSGAVIADPITPSRAIGLRPWQRLVARLLGLTPLLQWYRERPAGLSAPAFCRYALDRLGIRVEQPLGDWRRIPTTGRLIIVANHPFGGVDGLILIEQLLTQRPDLKVLANHLLNRLDELSPHLIPVDVFRQGVNQRAIRQAKAHLQAEGALLLFPAGVVKGLNWKTRRVSEAPWQETAASLVRHTASPVLPLYIEGQNRWRFQLAGLLHPLLRTLMLPRELRAMANKTVTVRMGEVIPFAEMAALERKPLTDFLYLNTLLLGQWQRPGTDASTRHSPVTSASPGRWLHREIQQLPPACLLHEQGNFAVFVAAAEQIPLTLRDIGRQRELSFRATGEGTGKDIDLDRFDQWYRHLFVWDRAAQRLVGAYRLGLVQPIVQQHGLEGLYTYSLFRFDTRFLARVGEAVELGRSFVAPEYQRQPQSLFLLWRGIGEYLGRLEGPQTLLGPVSISADYSATVRRLLTSLFLSGFSDPQLQRYVKPRTPDRQLPLPISPSLLTGLMDIRRLDRLIFRLEQSRGLPVLLRHYLRLNARFLGFNLDADFGNVLDGLVVVNLHRIHPKTLKRFMGPIHASKFIPQPLGKDRHAATPR